MAAATAVAAAAAQAPSVEFNNTRITEMAMQWVKPDGGESLMSYFQQVFPVAEKYGVRALGRLVPEEALVGDLTPSVIGMVEWPKLESFDGFMADADYRRLYPQRDAALDRLIVTHLRPIEDASVSFDPDKVYELSGLWIRPDGGRERLNDYYAQIQPIASEYGARSLLQFAGVRSAWGDFLPTEASVTEWPDKESWRRFLKDKRVVALDQLRTSALSKLTITRCSAQATGH
ncbi:MAG: DUF1330 domain-containing protein [Betaproteobacteria bacterium]|nr:MAG: DUF1330 domain-containing protein [Betaproteobacteria bacterium]